MGADAKMLESGPISAPGGFGGAKRFTWRVSLHSTAMITHSSTQTFPRVQGPSNVEIADQRHSSRTRAHLSDRDDLLKPEPDQGG